MPRRSETPSDVSGSLTRLGLLEKKNLREVLLDTLIGSLFQLDSPLGCDNKWSGYRHGWQGRTQGYTLRRRRNSSSLPRHPLYSSYRKKGALLRPWPDSKRLAI